MDTRKIALDNRIMEGVSGSHAYGTSLPTSDMDHRGLFVAPKIYTTPFFNIAQYQAPEPEDRVLYELSKFMQLLVDQNPNIVEFLWMDDSDIFYRTEVYDYIRCFRDELLSSKAKHTFSGYAMAQLKRIKGHNKWITNPQPVNPPRQTDYMKLVHNLTEDKVFNFDIYKFHKNYRLLPFDGNLFGVYQKDGYETFSEDFSLNTVYDPSEDFFTIKHKNSWYRTMCEWHGILDSRPHRRQPLFIVKFCKAQYKLDKENHKNYWTWKENRNKKRSALEEQHGYDTKHAMHLIRLMRMCKELLEDGVVNVKRNDAADLLEIRNGKYTYAELLEMADDYDDEMNVLYKTTSLRKSIAPKHAANILMSAQEMWWDR